VTDVPFGGLLAALPVGVVVLDDRARVVGLNRAFERLTGLRATDLRGKPVLGSLVRAAEGLEARLLEALAADKLDLTLDLTSADGRTVRLRGFDHDGRSWILGTLEVAEGPDGRPVADVDALVDRVSTAKHALNNVLMGLMGHAEILAGLREAPVAVRARGEALLEQCRRLREEIQRLELRAFRSRPAD